MPLRPHPETLFGSRLRKFTGTGSSGSCCTARGHAAREPPDSDCDIAVFIQDPAQRSLGCRFALNTDASLPAFVYPEEIAFILHPA
jgi:hypothetical protein